MDRAILDNGHSRKPRYAELDGTALNGVYPGERLKEFYPRRGIDRHAIEGYESDGGDSDNVDKNHEDDDAADDEK